MVSGLGLGVGEQERHGLTSGGLYFGPEREGSQLPGQIEMPSADHITLQPGFRRHLLCVRGKSSRTAVIVAK